jgi:hypothetical protein
MTMPGTKLTPSDLLSLEDYHRQRPAFRRRVIEEKKRRRLDIGDHAHLYFENRLTMHYQVQEMLRAEKIFEPEGIGDELAAYNPLIPDGDNFKATMMLQYTNVDERRAALARLVDIESHVWLRVANFERQYAIADEDAERATEDKTSAVHFLRFALDTARCEALKGGAALAFGIDHPHYNYAVEPVDDNLADALREDLS